MTTATTQRQPELTGQIAVIIGGGAGIGLQTARRARAEGAGMILAGRDPGLRERAAAGLGAPSSAAADAGPAPHERFFGGLPEQAGHVMVTAAGPAVR